MENDQRLEKKSILATPGAAEEFAAAIEAATGSEQTVLWDDPMDGPAVKAGFDKLLMTPRPDRGLDILIRLGMEHDDRDNTQKHVILDGPNHLDFFHPAAATTHHDNINLKSLTDSYETLETLEIMDRYVIRLEKTFQVEINIDFRLL